MFINKVRTGLVVMALTVAAGVFAVGSPASAAITCGSTVSDKDSSTGGQWTLDSSPLRTGPYESCAAITTLGAGTNVNYFCFFENTYGNTWTYVKVKGQNLYGWIFDDHLYSNGSPVRC